eukprot:CAMPEP_0117430642 /NCGR_PEP_ID=MMETSP0758-20121206/10197_1 /TAXON_ID=63605 /ORGANISM="Percolomonas cosmopolitus, Strain AE-1 (ATCC 50343)" /LENGTH=254 /DNA_ID=CAMNT_0005218897 /DNA_START=143 /DNA_END=903 /DNA_ORIENTATION=-
MVERIKKENPGLKTYQAKYYENTKSILSKINDQLVVLAAEIEEAKTKLGIKEHNLVCHSMGGLLCRAYLMAYGNHTVNRYISLAGVHAGQFGLTGQVEKYAPAILTNLARENIYRFIYKAPIQDHFSVAGFWKDPLINHTTIYKEECDFLPIYNGDKQHANAAAYKKNFLKLKKVVFNGCKTDEILEPPLTAVFSYYAPTDAVSKLTVTDYTHHDIYNKDVFGLKTMLEDKRASMNVIDVCGHTEWLFREDLYT